MTTKRKRRTRAECEAEREQIYELIRNLVRVEQARQQLAETFAALDPSSRPKPHRRKSDAH